MTDSLTQRALQMARYQRKPLTAPLLHHSAPKGHPGSQYTSDDYQRLLDHHGLGVSMSGTGNCYDNAHMESFFAQLKVEWVYPHRSPARQVAKSSLFRYIEGFYNPHRIHSALGYLSPAQFDCSRQNTASIKKDAAYDPASSFVP